AWPGAVSRAPLRRTWPASMRAAALLRALTTRACHNHLSRRWRSTGALVPVDVTRSVLAVGGELFLQCRELGEGRIGVDRAVAITLTGRGRLLAQRRPVTLVAGCLVAAVVAPTALTIASIAIVAAVAAELFAAPFVIALPALALLVLAIEALAPAMALLDSLGRGPPRPRHRRAFRPPAFPPPAEVLVPIAPAIVATPFPLVPRTRLA